MTTKLAPTNALSIPLDGIISDWLHYEQQANDASDNTIKAYQRCLRKFEAWLSERGLTLGTITPADVLDFKAAYAQQFSAQTVNLHLVAVRSFYRYAVVTGQAPYNPASEIKGVKRKKSKSHKRDALANSEVVNVLEQPETENLIGLRDKAILVLLAYCALRSVEIYRANIEDLHTRNDRLTLDVWGKGHTEADEFVVIKLEWEPVIREWLKHRLTIKENEPDSPLFISLSNRSKGERLSLRSIRQIVKGYYGLAGVVGRNTSTHSLRHSAITNAIRRGATPMQVQAMARHLSYDTTLVYFHETGRLDNPAEDVISYE